MPESVPIFRDEIQSALAEINGVFTSGAIQNMKKLDSFLKETMRYYPLGSSKLLVLFHCQLLTCFTSFFSTKGPQDLFSFQHPSHSGRSHT
jgi:hypothetical protein